MLLTRLAAEREVLFVGGKGGVGKTVVASALALSQARSGRPTLVVSTDPAHNLGHLWQRRIGDTPVELAPLLHGLEIDPVRTTDAHLDAVRDTMQHLLPEHLQGEVAKHLDLAREAPGTHEAAILERIAEVVEQRRPDELVIFDTAPSGHTARLVELPELMQAWTSGLLRRQVRSSRFGAALRGLRGNDDDPGDRTAADIIGRSASTESSTEGAAGEKSRWSRESGRRRIGWVQDRRARRDAEIKEILDRRASRFAGLRTLLQDPQRSSFVVACAAERLPVLETVELTSQLHRSGMSVGGLVVNKRSPADAGDLLAQRRTIEDGYLAQLTAALPEVPVVEVPLLPGEVLGVDGLTRLAEHLTAQHG